MATRVPFPRPERQVATIVRAVRSTPRVRVPELPAVARSPATDVGVSPELELGPNPYVDYARLLTAEGGILLMYKDIDERMRHTLWRKFAWWSFTGLEAWFTLRHLDPQWPWIGLAALAVAGFLNNLIVIQPVEVYRRVEIRLDAMIIEGEDVFWQRYMDGGPPAFRPAANGQMLCGIYGTRFVEYLTIRRFDDNDRMPEIFAAHLQAAMEQLWTQPS